MSRAARAAAAAGVLLAPLAARAHLVSTGLGPFYDGVSHLALTPEDLLLVVAFALLAGQGGPAAGRALLVALPAAWAVAGVAGLAAPGGREAPAAPWLALLIAGGLVAADLRLPVAAVVVLGAAAGLHHGYLNGGAMALEGGGGLALAGIVAALLVVGLLAAAVSVAAREGWRRVAVRVAGSWIAALGLLAFGWSLRGR